MAYSSIENLQLGKFLQIAFSEGIRFQLSGDVRDWDMIRKAREGDPNGREIRFLIQTSLGPAAIQAMNPGVAGTFPRSQDISVKECTAQYKEIAATIEFDYNLWQAAQKSPAKYADFLAKEIQSKVLAYKRQISIELYGDGTGVIGQLGASAASVTSPVSNSLNFQLDTSSTARGFVGWFTIGDILILRASNGGSSGLVTTPVTPTYWKVLDIDRKNDKVRLQGLDASFNPVANLTAVTTQPSSGSVFYRYAQPTIPDLTASISDYGTVTEVMTGLDSLISNDGRIVHGINMEGSTSGTIVDAGASVMDVSLLQELLDLTKVRVGQDAYKYKIMAASPEAHAALIESREVDRRFNTHDDKTRGIRGFFTFAHNNDLIEFYTSEFCQKKRLYVLPEHSSGQKVLEYHATDFEQVKVNDMSAFNLKPDSSGYARRVITFMHGRHTLICLHPAAIGKLVNFTL